MDDLNPGLERFLYALTGGQVTAATVTSKAKADDPFWKTVPYTTCRFNENRNNYASTAMYDPPGPRKKENFVKPFAIMFDDVKELCEDYEGEEWFQDRVEFSWVIETSPGSFQAGIFLDAPDLSYDEVSNLVKEINRKAKSPFDHGAGVRLMRLPNSINNKPKYLGEHKGGFKVRLVKFEPEVRYTTTKILEAFDIPPVALTAGADKEIIQDDCHPIMRLGLSMTPVNGGYEIDCPWADEHPSEPVRKGMVFLMADKTVGYHCFHSACAERKGRALVDYLDALYPGFKLELLRYKRPFKAVKDPGSLLNRYENLEALQADLVHVADVERYFSRRTGRAFTVTAVMARNRHLVSSRKALDEAMIMGTQCLVEALGFAPGKPRVYCHNRELYFNLWTDENLGKPSPGDPSPWLNLVKSLYPKDYNHILDYLAFTMQYPHIKINHGVVLMGAQGIGKDCMIQPIMRYFGSYAKTISPTMLLGEFTSWLENAKLIYVNELATASFKLRCDVHEHLKPILCAPPNTVNINKKGIPAYEIENLVSVIMSTNQDNPIPLDAASRRIFFAESLMPASEASKLAAAQVYGWYDRNDGIGKSINYLLSRDVSHFNPGAAPYVTEMAEGVLDASKSDVQLYMEERLQDKSPHVEGEFLIPDITTWQDLHKYMELHSRMHGGGYDLRAVSRLRGRISSDAYHQFSNPHNKDFPRRVVAVRNLDRYASMTGPKAASHYRPCGQFSRGGLTGIK